MKKYLIILLFIAITFSGCKKVSFSDLDKGFLVKPNIFTTHQSSKDKVVENKVAEIPSSFYIENVPFVSQAPLRVWDDLHNEACEEAATLSVIHYLKNEHPSAKEIDQELINAVNWQLQNFGGHYDLPLEKLKDLVEKYFSQKSEIIINPSIEDIKKLVSQNNPVILPTAGRVLGNPYFRSPGPVYHMIVIRGYDDKTQEFIVHDVGTNTKGEDFHYKYDILYNAIHDMPSWPLAKADLDTNPDMIFSGQKAVMVIKSLVQ